MKKRWYRKRTIAQIGERQKEEEGAPAGDFHATLMGERHIIVLRKKNDSKEECLAGKNYRRSH